MAKENASSTQPPEKSILDYEDHELTPGHKACKKRFIQFDQKIRDEQAALNYESNTESSRSSQHSDKPLDFDKDFDENFFKRSVELQKKGQINMLEIIEKHADKRTNEQRDHLVCHLMYKVPFFADYRRDLMIAICERIESKVFEEKEALMNQGEQGDCMYIIYSGKCGIYKLAGGEYSEVASISANSVVG